jgi:hypothetical protein
MKFLTAIGYWVIGAVQGKGHSLMAFHARIR